MNNAVISLTGLKDVDLDLRQLAIDIVKYQDFKPKVAVPKLSGSFKDSTKNNYFTNGVMYIKYSKVSKILNKKIYQYIDEALKNCVQPLTPSKEDRKITYKKTFTKKNIILPVNKVLNEIKSKEKEKFEYGVRLEDNIKVFKTREDAVMFLSGIRFASNDTKARLVSVSDIIVKES